MPTEDPWFPIATEIRHARERRALSQARLAERLGVHRNTIRNWEDGRPFRIGQCDAIAEQLDLDPVAFRSLHPDAVQVPTGEWGRSAWEFLTRPAVIASIVTALVAGFMVLTWQIATADCVATGAGGGGIAARFQDAFGRFGGVSTLGCATSEVHTWDDVYVQDFRGGTIDRSILMSADRKSVYVLGGEAWLGYMAVAGGATAQLAGAPTSLPRRCGEGVVVTTDGGAMGPGALVSRPDGTMVWLDPDLWATYRSYGGPTGELGLPVAATVDGTVRTAAFEYGSIVRAFGEAPTVEPAGIQRTGFDIDACDDVDLETAFGVDRVTIQGETWDSPGY